MLALLRDPRGLATGRMAVGVGMLVRPALLPAALGVERETGEQLGWVVQMLGAREVALGAGALLSSAMSSRSRAPKGATRLWLLGGLISDTVDAVAVGAALRRGQVRGPAAMGAVGIALFAAAVQVDALRR